MSNYLGSEASAALGVSTLLVTCIIGLINGLAIGSNVAIAIAFSRGGEEGLRNTVWMSLLVGFFGGIALAGVGFVLVPHYVVAMNIPAVSQETATIFLQTYFVVMVAVAIYNMAAAVSRAVGGLSFSDVCPGRWRGCQYLIQLASLVGPTARDRGSCAGDFCLQRLGGCFDDVALGSKGNSCSCTARRDRALPKYGVRDLSNRNSIWIAGIGHYLLQCSHPKPDRFIGCRCDSRFFHILQNRTSDLPRHCGGRAGNYDGRRAKQGGRPVREGLAGCLYLSGAWHPGGSCPFGIGTRCGTFAFLVFRPGSRGYRIRHERRANNVLPLFRLLDFRGAGNHCSRSITGVRSGDKRIRQHLPAEGVPRFGSNQGCGVGGGDSLCVSDNLGHGIIVYARLCIYAAEERRCAHGFVRSRYHSGIVVTMRSPLRTPFVPRSASERLFTRLDFPFNMIVSKQ